MVDLVTIAEEDQAATVVAGHLLIAVVDRLAAAHTAAEVVDHPVAVAADRQVVVDKTE